MREPRYSGLRSRLRAVAGLAAAVSAAAAAAAAGIL